MDERQTQLGIRIRQARKKRKLSQAQLAEAVQISISHMSDIENGKTRISLDIFYRLAMALEVSADWLLETNSPDTPAILDSEFADLLTDCTPSEKRLFLKVARDVKEYLRAAED